MPSLCFYIGTVEKFDGRGENDIVNFTYQIFEEKIRYYKLKLISPLGHNKIDLIIISSHCKKVNCQHKFVKNCSPEHFLELIKNATYVVTDSFHGTALSFNFNRNVFVFNPPKYSTRLTSVLELFKSEFRLVDNKDWKDIEPLNYEQINKILSAERDKAKFFLSEYLN